MDIGLYLSRGYVTISYSFTEKKTCLDALLLRAYVNVTATTFVCSHPTCVGILAVIRIISWTRVLMIDTHSVWPVAHWEICKSEFIVKMKYCNRKVCTAYPNAFVIKLLKNRRV